MRDFRPESEVERWDVNSLAHTGRASQAPNRAVGPFSQSWLIAFPLPSRCSSRGL